MPDQRPRRFLAVVTVLTATVSLTSITTAEDEITLENVKSPPPITKDEPLAKPFSLRKAADYLDTIALDWQKTRNCGTCHTNFAYLMARPSLQSVSSARPEVRTFFENMVTTRWEEKGPRWPAEVVVAGVTLALNDRQTTGKLHPVTRTALDRMWTLQRDDGGWKWLNCGWPPMEMDDHFGVTFAAIGVGAAPDGYAKTQAARQGLKAIRRYLKENPAPTAHHRAMLLWASRYTDGILSSKEQREVLDELLSMQLDDGGWAIAGLLAGWEDFKRKDDQPQDTEHGDGYATGLVVYLARQFDVPPTDERLRRAVDWIKSNQRESGRWFTRSPTKDSKHFLSNYGTAFAVMALRACGEVPGASAKVAANQ